MGFPTGCRALGEAKEYCPQGSLRLGLGFFVLISSESFLNPEDNCIIFTIFGSSWEEVFREKKKKIIDCHLLGFSLQQHKPLSLYFISRPDRRADQGGCLYGTRNKQWEWVVLFQLHLWPLPIRVSEKAHKLTFSELKQNVKQNELACWSLLWHVSELYAYSTVK